MEDAPGRLAPPAASAVQRLAQELSAASTELEMEIGGCFSCCTAARGRCR